MEIQWHQEDIQAGDMTVHYARSYSAGQPPLILAHGYTDNGLCLLPYAQALAEEYDVILPDARGHGLSSRLTPGQPIDLAADLAAFIDALLLERPIVGGHSMGASTAADLAARFPGCVSALILEDPAWFDRQPDDPEKETQRAEGAKQWLASFQNGQSLEEIIAAGRAHNPTWNEAVFPNWAAAKQQFDPNYLTTRDVLPPTPWLDTVRAIQVPTLLVTADTQKGAIVSADNAAIAVEANPLIEVVYLPEAGHNIRREDYDDFMEAVYEFLRSLRQGN